MRIAHPPSSRMVFQQQPLRRTSDNLGPAKDTVLFGRLVEGPPTQLTHNAAGVFNGPALFLAPSHVEMSEDTILDRLLGGDIPE